jgi:hypothetical protein
MKTNGDYDVSEVPDLIRRGGPKELLGARAALLSAAEDIADASDRNARAMTPTEQRNFDYYTEQIRSVNEKLAEYKRQRIANNDSDLPVIFPF